MHIEGNVGKAIIKQLYGEMHSNFREACEDFERHPNVWITLILTQVLSSDHQLHGHLLHRKEKTFEIA
jgi:hypothetical protein